MGFQCPAVVFRRDPGTGGKGNHLAQGVDPCIGPSGGLDLDGFLQHFRQGLFQHLLDPHPVFLPLEPLVTGSVIGHCGFNGPDHAGIPQRRKASRANRASITSPVRASALP